MGYPENISMKKYCSIGVIMKNIVLVLLVILIFCFMSCDLPSEDNMYGLEGVWVVSEASTDYSIDLSSYERLVFENYYYEIRQKDGNLIEKGPVSNITEGSFDYTIEEAPSSPDLVGGENSGEFTIDINLLEITFTSRDGSLNYCTFKAIKNPNY